jgi:hypothetical protein
MVHGLGSTEPDHMMLERYIVQSNDGDTAGMFVGPHSQWVALPDEALKFDSRSSAIFYCEGHSEPLTSVSIRKHMVSEL